jgi:predicted flavoprotein YhiN
MICPPQHRYAHAVFSVPQITKVYDRPVKFDVVIIGGGAAGLMCAIEAGRRGRSVSVLERNETVGKKIRISGGGRCNFTNIYSSSDTFISANPHFHKSALARYAPEDFIRLVRRHHIAYHEKKLGQLFCDGSSQQIIDVLLKECAEAHVDVRIDCAVGRIDKDARFALETNHGNIECESLVIASGGLSIPKIGATDFGYRVAKQFGLRITETHPGLVPIALDGDEGRALRELAGVSLDAQVSCGHIAFRENILFTHRGLSGPAILQISSYWKRGETILIEPKSFPRRFIQKWKELYVEAPIAEWKLAPTGTEGYAKAEVTVGGIDTTELSSKTMEARRVPGLYFIGEVVDVTGHLGGFNFQWAWASGFVAGQYV